MQDKKQKIKSKTKKVFSYQTYEKTAEIAREKAFKEKKSLSLKIHELLTEYISK